MRRTRMFTAALAVLTLTLLQACASGGIRKPDEVTGSVKIKDDGSSEVTVTAKWKIPQFASLTGASFNAGQFVVTREVDPSHLSYTNGVRYGTLILDLSNGSTVSYSGALAYSSYWSNQIPPADPSKRVLAFVPANPSALQNFVDQYSSQATDADFTSKIGLASIYSGDLTVTYVDTQYSYQGDREFANRLGTRVGERPGGGGPPPYFAPSTGETDAKAR